MSRKLTIKQKRFCRFYIMHWNGSKAAREAGYSVKTAYSMAYELLKKPEVQAHIDSIKDDYEKTCHISKTRQLNELAKLAYSNIADFHNTWVSLEEFERLSIDQKAAIAKTETRTTKDLNGDVQTFVKIELHSKLNALSQISDLMGYKAPEKKQVVKQSTKKDLSKLSYEQLRKLSGTDKRRG